MGRVTYHVVSVTGEGLLDAPLVAWLSDDTVDPPQLAVLPVSDPAATQIMIQWSDASSFTTSDSVTFDVDEENQLPKLGGGLWYLRAKSTHGASESAFSDAVSGSIMVLAPVVTSSNAVSVDEGVTLAHTLTADEPVAWSISGGEDLTNFQLSDDVLQWAGDGTKDFASPDDLDGDNDYIVMVRATSDRTGLTSDQTITVTVNDV